MRSSDGSSDVCSSDLFWVGVLQWLVDNAAIGAVADASFFLFPAVMVTIMALLLDDIARAVERRHYPDLPPARSQPLGEAVFGNVIFEIGRASCRERVCQYV